MNPEFSQTLWSDSERSRFFLIPSDRQIPPGDFNLRSITGRQMTVERSLKLKDKSTISKCYNI